MNDDFNMDDFFEEEFDSSELKRRIEEFSKKLRMDAMYEAYRFIKDVGILFWIRKDMYVKNSRKKKILEHMITFFTETEEYEKCAYLYKGVLILEEAQIEKEINEQFNNTKIN